MVWKDLPIGLLQGIIAYSTRRRHENRILWDYVVRTVIKGMVRLEMFRSVIVDKAEDSKLDDLMPFKECMVMFHNEDWTFDPAHR